MPTVSDEINDHTQATSMPEGALLFDAGVRTPTPKGSEPLAGAERSDATGCEPQSASDPEGVAAGGHYERRKAARIASTPSGSVVRTATLPVASLRSATG